jgi:hypothetical protein
MRAIDADVLKRHIDKLPALPDGNFAGNHSALKALINMQPTIEPSTNNSEIPNSSDTISRKAAIDALDEYFVRIGELKRRGLNKGEKAISLDTVGVIKTLPPAQPKRGRWLYCEDTTADCVDGYRCDQCGLFVPWDYQHKSIGYIKDYNFCPNCGAKMEE